MPAVGVTNPDDPRRPDKIRHYKAQTQPDSTSISDHVNALGMVFSLVGLLLRVRGILVDFKIVIVGFLFFADEVGSVGRRVLHTDLRS